MLQVSQQNQYCNHILVGDLNHDGLTDIVIATGTDAFDRPSQIVWYEQGTSTYGLVFIHLFLIPLGSTMQFSFSAIVGLIVGAIFPLLIVSNSAFHSPYQAKYHTVLLNNRNSY